MTWPHESNAQKSFAPSMTLANYVIDNSYHLMFDQPDIEFVLFRLVTSINRVAS